MGEKHLFWSEREGLREVRSKIQDDGTDERTRARLWNVVHGHVLRGASKYAYTAELRALWHRLGRTLHDFTQRDAENQLMQMFLIGEDWARLYDVLEWLALSLPDSEGAMLAADAKEVLEEEKSAWTFVERRLVRRTTEAELKTLEVALLEAKPFAEVHSQLDKALAEFSAREAPDYAHSANQAVSALETLCRIVVDDPDVTLGEALKSIRASRKPDVHGALLRALENVWGYASDRGLIRHGAKPGDASDVTMEEAQFVLGTCAAAVSFLIVVASKEGLLKLDD